MTALSKELHSLVRIQFQDCDPFRHLNNARYIDYFVNARQEQLEKFYGFRIFDPAHPDEKSWITIKNQIAYLAPAQMMETVEIRTRLMRYTQRTLLVEGLMFDASGEQLKAVIWMEFMYVDPQAMRPTLHAEDLMAFFANVHYADESIDFDKFDTRVQVLRKALKHKTIA